MAKEHTLYIGYGTIFVFVRRLVFTCLGFLCFSNNTFGSVEFITDKGCVRGFDLYRKMEGESKKGFPEYGMFCFNEYAEIMSPDLTGAPALNSEGEIISFEIPKEGFLGVTFMPSYTSSFRRAKGDERLLPKIHNKALRATVDFKNTNIVESGIGKGSGGWGGTAAALKIDAKASRLVQTREYLCVAQPLADFDLVNATRRAIFIKELIAGFNSYGFLVVVGGAKLTISFDARERVEFEFLQTLAEKEFRLLKSFDDVGKADEFVVEFRRDVSKRTRYVIRIAVKKHAATEKLIAKYPLIFQDNR